MPISKAFSPRPKSKAAKIGRPRVEDAKTKFIAVRCTAGEHTLIDGAAARAGLSVGAYLRSVALGKPGLRAKRRPPIEQVELARLLGELGKIGSNVNQIAHAYNSRGRTAELAELTLIKREIERIRAAIMKALDRDH